MGFDTLPSLFVQNIEGFLHLFDRFAVSTRICFHAPGGALATLAAITLENTGGMSANQNIM